MRMFEMNAPAAKFTADTPVLLRERDGDVAILVLNRPEARNSLSEALLIALSDSLSELATDKTVRAVVLAANGPAFCAGHDLKELTSRRSDGDGGRAYFRKVMTLCSAMMQQIVNLPLPMIAAVQGVATAAGCQLVATAIWQLHPPKPNLPRLVSTSVCSVRRQWLHSPAMLRASMPWRCC